MSYDAHITRAPDWSISDELPIGLEEWEALAGSVDLVKTSFSGYFYARAVRETATTHRSNSSHGC
jgi:hypothetical protein